MSHVAKLDLPLLTRGGREAHIVRGLVSHDLVSVVKLSNAGWQVDARDILCEIRYKGKTIIQCSKDVSAVLWMLPLTNRIEKPTYNTQQNDKENVTFNRNCTVNGAMSAESTSNSDWASAVPEWEECKPKLGLKRFGSLLYISTGGWCQTRTTAANGEESTATPQLVKRRPRLPNWSIEGYWTS